MALICRTNKIGKYTSYQLEPDSEIYLTLQEMSESTNLPVYLLRGRIYSARWPKEAMDPTPRLPPTAPKPLPPQTVCAYPGCNELAPPKRAYCGKSHSVRHRHMLNKEKGLIHYTGDKTQVKNRAAAKKIDRSSHCFRGNKQCVHYHLWLSEETGFFCVCRGYQAP